MNESGSCKVCIIISFQYKNKRQKRKSLHIIFYCCKLVDVFFLFLHLQKRGKRSTEAHYVVYVNFLDNNKGFLEKSLSNKYDENELAEDWHSLVVLLNAVPGGPILDQKSWHIRLQDWRHKLNGKGRALCIDANSTGGGETKAKPLRDYELRAVNLFNATSTTGNQKLLTEAGMSKEFQIPTELRYKTNDNVDPLDNQYVEILEASENAGASTSSTFAMDESSNDVDTVLPRQPSFRSPNTSRSSLRRTNSNRQRIDRSRSRVAQSNSNVEMYLKKMNEMEQKRQEVTQNIVGNVCSSLNQFSNSISSLAQAIAQKHNEN